MLENASPERQKRIQEIRNRYVDNIRNTKMYKRYERNNKTGFPGAHDGYYTRVARSTYMGNSNG